MSGYLHIKQIQTDKANLKDHTFMYVFIQIVYTIL